MKHMKCGKEKGGFSQLHQCMRNYDAQMEWIILNVPKENRVLTACCSLHWVHHCFVERSKAMCDAITGPETSGYFDKMVAATVSLDRVELYRC